MTFLLDTNACIDYLNGASSALVERVLAAGPRLISVSSLTVAELHFGAARSARRDANVARIHAFVSELATLPFDDHCAARFGTIKAQMLSLGRPIPDSDLAIAATALVRALTVISTDRHLSGVPGLAVEDWTTVNA